MFGVVADLLALCALAVEGLALLLQDLGLGVAMVSFLGASPAGASDLVGFQVVLGQLL